MSTLSPGMPMSLLGMGLGASAADKRRDEYQASLDKWLPNTNVYQQDWFKDMGNYLPEATKLSKDMGAAEQDAFLANRERAMPGFTKGIQDASAALFPLLKGELPKGVMEGFARAGGASTNSLGFGGSPFGALNTGLFGARGSLGAMQTGFGLLPSLMSTLPNLQQTSVASILGQGIMNPLQRTQTQLQIRGQNLGVAGNLAQMPTGLDMWGQGLTSMGGQIMGADAATTNTLIGSAASQGGGGGGIMSMFEM